MPAPRAAAVPPSNPPPGQAPLTRGQSNSALRPVRPVAAAPRPATEPEDMMPMSGSAASFTAALDAEALAYFSKVAKEPFSKQAVAFLNAYWPEVGSQAEFIFTVAWETMKYADMHTKGISLIHLYDEGADLDFNIGLYFYEKLCNKVLEAPEGKKWRQDSRFAPSMPEMLTAIVRKQELREKVDVNFDGRISFLEYLLYQYREFTNPADFVKRSLRTAEMPDHPEIIKARAALEEVNEAIRAYEREKARLMAECKQPGVRGLAAQHTLAQLAASPLAEKLNKALISAEAAVRIATRKFGPGGTEVVESEDSKPVQGSLWWLNRDMEDKKKLYGRRASQYVTAS